jgi:hypothetical protein
LEFIAEYRLPEAEGELELPRRYLIISRSDEGEIRWDNLFHILSKTNELLVATNQLIYTIARQTDSDIRLAHPIIELIKFGSPGLVEILTALGVSSVLNSVFGYLRESVLDKKRYLEGTKQLERENDNLSLENERKVIENICYETKISQETERRSIAIGQCIHPFTQYFDILQVIL